MSRFIQHFMVNFISMLSFFYFPLLFKPRYIVLFSLCSSDKNELIFRNAHILGPYRLSAKCINLFIAVSATWLKLSCLTDPGVPHQAFLVHVFYQNTTG